MSVPAFSFTSRAVPVAQIGRLEPLDPATVTWVDIGCDVYEITTDTGRGSASDRFVPGTAVISASNVSGWASGTVPLQWTYFADEFARSGPELGSHWERWPAFETDRTADELVIVDEAATVQGRPTGDLPAVFDVEGGCTVVGTYSATASALADHALIGPFPEAEVGDLVLLSLQLQHNISAHITIEGVWTVEASSGPMEWRDVYYSHRITGEEAELNVPWVASWSGSGVAGWTWTAVVVRGVGAIDVFAGQTTFWAEGTSGVFEDFESDQSVTTDSDGCVVARFFTGEHTHSFDGDGGGGSTSYLTGYATTPSAGVPTGVFTYVMHVRGPVGTNPSAPRQMIAGQWGATGQQGWRITRNQSSSGFGNQFWFEWTYDGSTYHDTNLIDFAPAQAVWFAVQCQVGNTFALWYSYDGTSWTSASSFDGFASAVFNTTTPISIGATATGSDAWNDQIFWFELRNGSGPTGGSVVWRFDAADAPAGVLSYTDPRGRTWTLDSTSAIGGASSAVDEIVYASVGWDAMQFLVVEGPFEAGTTITNSVYPWTSDVAAVLGETTSGVGILFVPGAYPPPASVPMEGASCALWGVDYAGDQFIATTLTGMAAPERVWPSANTTIELVTHANNIDLAAIVAVLEWVPDWDDPDVTGRLTWKVTVRDGGGSDFVLATGFVDFDAAGFPVPAHVRFESTAKGGFTLTFEDAVLGSAPDFDLGPLTGHRIGIAASYYAGSLSYGRTHQPGPPRFEAVIAGSDVPVPIYLEPGVLVRVGVDHQTHGEQWFFHGYVDAIVPTYDPTRNATAQIECIDSLGEIGRLRLDDIGGYNPEEAWERVTRLCREAEWPAARRDIADDATWMENRSSGPDRAVDLLTGTAESCGGAVYGDPQNGHIVFRARDWQAWDPDSPPDGYITNASHPSGVLAACPSTWERSWRREEMTTRVTYTGGTDPHNGVQETRQFSNPDAEARFGVEAYDRTLVCIQGFILTKLGRRQLRLRGPEAFPRVAAVLLDAATGDGALDVMTLSTFTTPSRYQCGLVIDGATVFDRQFLVTGVRHTITRDRWQCRLGLDIADVFATKGARWGRGHWGVGVWGHSI